MTVLATDRMSNRPVVTIKLASTSDELLQCYALRAAVFMGEQQCPYWEEFDGNDYSASHLMLYVDGEPAASMRVERCRQLAEGRGCNMLYAQVLPSDTGYWEKQDWRRLVPEAMSSGPKPIVAMVKPVDPDKPMPEVEAPEAIVLRREPALDSRGIPVGAIAN